MIRTIETLGLWGNWNVESSRGAPPNSFHFLWGCPHATLGFPLPAFRDAIRRLDLFPERQSSRKTLAMSRFFSQTGTKSSWYSSVTFFLPRIETCSVLCRPFPGWNTAWTGEVSEAQFSRPRLEWKFCWPKNNFIRRTNMRWWWKRRWFLRSNSLESGNTPSCQRREERAAKIYIKVEVKKVRLYPRGSRAEEKGREGDCLSSSAQSLCVLAVRW